MLEKRTFYLTILAAFLILFNCGRNKTRWKGISVYPENPYYFAYKGKPVLLLGGSDEDNLFNHPGLMMENLNILKKIGGNYIRCTMSSRDSGNVWAFARNSHGKYDLNRFNPEYWRRFENCLEEAERRDIIVQVEIWATFDFYRQIWLENPFNPENNVNYSEVDTRLKAEWPHHPAAKPQPFFSSVPALNNDTLVLQYQIRFVDKLLNIAFKHQNVLFCLDNETRAPEQWAWFWAVYLKQEARQAKVPLLLTEMWDAHDLQNKEHRRTYLRKDLFPFFDISQNNWQEGQRHYDNALWARSIVQKNGGIRPLTNVKVYHRRSGGKPNEPLVGLDRWWQNIWAGCAATRFHRPTGGTGLNKISRAAIKSARIFTNRFNIFRCQPHTDLLENRQANEAYCLACPGEVYALYFPKGGSVKLNLEDSKSKYQVKWFDPKKSIFLRSVEEGGNLSLNLTSPDEKQSWLVLVKKK